MSGENQRSLDKIAKEDPNLAIDVKSENLVLRLWFLMHRDVGLLRRCEDQVYGEKGLTTEQFTVLAAMKYIGPTASPSDIAEWIGRTANTISMIVDRMVKAGLVRRTRDRKDRRVVRVVATKKGEDAFARAIPAGWEFIHKIMLPLSPADRETLAGLLDTIRHETLDYLNPGQDIVAMVANDDKSHTKMMERLYHNVMVSAPGTKRETGRKGKTVPLG
jgi:DNA-binding MarR family transcriptional regulator